jgi:hypothetical protein
MGQARQIISTPFCLIAAINFKWKEVRVIVRYTAAQSSIDACPAGQERDTTARQVFRVIVALDIERFGRPDRDDRTRVQLRDGLRALLTRALTSASIAPGTWSATTTGDGLLVVVDPAVETARVLRAILDRFVDELAGHNRIAGELTSELRVSAALHAAHVMLDEEARSASTSTWPSACWTRKGCGTGCGRRLDRSPTWSRRTSSPAA